MLYRVGRAFMRGILFFVFRFRFVGRENVPAEGGVIYAVNHRSYWDVIAAGFACPRPLRFMAKSELFRNKTFGFLIRHLGAFPVHRGRGDVGAVKSALKILRNGEVMLMFPEGRRIRRGAERPSEAKAGVAMIAAAAKAPVVPVYISGAYRWMGKITVNMGEPISLEEYYDQKLTMRQLQEISNGILKTMRSLETQ